MSVEHLIPSKNSQFLRQWRRRPFVLMMTNQPAAASGAQNPKPAQVSSIEGLEQRRGSIPLPQLKDDESDFFDLIERGNVAAIEKFLNDHRNLNINSINYKGLSALHIAIKNQHQAIVQLLFQRTDLEMKDAALHAVATGNTDLTEIILDAINKINPGSETKGYEESPDYTSDITPLILAAQLGDFEMVRMLMARGHKIEKPHIPTCLCPRCKELMREAGSAFSQMRLNAYKAICNPSYICQVTNDPIFYGFLLDQELTECSVTDKEFRAEYIELSQQVRDFTVEVLSKCRNTTEIEMLLKLPWGYEGKLENCEFPRLQVAIDFKQKEFVAHSMVQQVLTSYWLGEFSKWSRLRLWQKCLHVLLRAVFLPFICLPLLCVPRLKFFRKFQAPINRYLLNLASYMLFLLFVFLLNFLDTGNFERGPPKTGFEAIVIIYVLGFIVATFRLLWVQGKRRFFGVPWNWYDMALQSLYIVIFILWFVSYLDVQSDKANKKKEEARKFWHKYDTTLLHEGLFAVATVLSFGKLAFFCLQSSRMGPLQVSMGKMLTQIVYFLIFCFLIITSFSVPMARSYAYYTGMTQKLKDGTSRSQLPSFSTFRHSFSTFFWAMFCMSPVESTDVVVENLVADKQNPVINSHDFTETVGMVLFATYELIMVIALLNTLIAILSNTFQRVVDNADVEFKFARTKLWTHFFDESSLFPSPFNLLLTHRTVVSCCKFCQILGGKVPGAKVAFSITKCCYIQYDKEPEVDVSAYEILQVISPANTDSKINEAHNMEEGVWSVRVVGALMPQYMLLKPEPTLVANLVQRYFRSKEED